MRTVAPREGLELLVSAGARGGGQMSNGVTKATFNVTFSSAAELPTSESKMSTSGLE